MGLQRVWRKGAWQWVDVVDAEVPGGGSFSGNLSDLTIDADKNWNAKKITNLADAAVSTGAATKGQMDTALALKAALANPTFTGVPAAPTAALGTNTTQLATTAFVIANAGVATLSSLSINADKDWAGKSISNMLDLAVSYLETLHITPISGTDITIGANLLDSLGDTYNLGSGSNMFLNVAAKYLVGRVSVATNSIGPYSGSNIALTANILPTDLTYNNGAVGNAWSLIVGSTITAIALLNANAIQPYSGSLVTVTGLNIGSSSIGSAKNTTYTNNSGKALAVSVVVSLNAGDSATLYTHASADPPTDIDDRVINSTGSAQLFSLHADVPVGYKYRVTITAGTSSIDNWREKTIG